ncbi:MAG: hypothetical protein RIT15_1075 [Pseudomonadota bacterium]
MRMSFRWFTKKYKLGSGLCLLLMASWLQAQDGQPTSASAQQLISVPGSLDAAKDSRVFSPARVFSKPSSSGVNYDLKERPPGKPSAPTLNTVVETRVENKTTNFVGGGGGGGGPDRPPPENVDRPPSGVPSSAFGNDFSSLVRTSVGTVLPLFGSTYIMSDAGKNTALDPLTVPVDYRVGPGDEVLIRAWGQIDIDFQGPIDRAGMIFLPKIGSVMLAGQKLSDLQSVLKTAIGQQYKSFELTASLGSLRQIQYYMTGFAKQVGVHTTESTATALHGLIASGGALAEGDLRKIELRRSGKVFATIDAYEFLTEGHTSIDPQLQPGDVLHVPAAKGFFAVAGNVRRSAIYHLKDGMTLADALSLAGGVALGQELASVRRERLKTDAVYGQTRQMDVFPADAANLAKPLEDGDLLMLLPVSPRFDTAVTLRGNVAQPLRQPHFTNMRVSDLLNPATAFIRPAVWSERNSPAALDGLTRTGRAVDFTTEFPNVNWDYASIERYNRDLQEVTVIPFNLGKALKKIPTEDLVLSPGDVVIIYAKADFRQPEVQTFRTVRVEGEVGIPGVYPIQMGETLKDVLKRAGGLTDRAYIFGTLLSRLSARKTESMMLKEASDRIEQDYLRYLSSRARNATSADEGSIGYPEMEAIKSLVQKLRAVEPDGRVALDLKNAQADFSNYPDLILEDQDKVIIPSLPATVAVMGAVFRQGTLLWARGSTAKDYVENAGGVRQHADTKGLVIFKADGTVKQQGYSWFSPAWERLNPGDTVFVPEDVQSSGWTRLFRDWSQIFYQLGLGTAALKILKSSL